MNVCQIDGATRVLGEAQGYIGLPIRDVIIVCAVDGDVPAMLSHWRPTPEELAVLNDGGPVQLRVVGSAHPPVMLDVVPGAASAETSTPGGGSDL